MTPITKFAGAKILWKQTASQPQKICHPRKNWRMSPEKGPPVTGNVHLRSINFHGKAVSFQVEKPTKCRRSIFANMAYRIPGKNIWEKVHGTRCTVCLEDHAKERPFGRGTSLLRGLRITMVINHLLNGMILPVEPRWQSSMSFS